MPRTPFLALLALSLLAGPARAAVVRLEAYGPDGRLLDQAALRALLDPAQSAPSSGLRLSGPDGAPLDGRPWWVADSTTPAWSFEGGSRAVATLPWPLPEDGYSTVRLDAEGLGYEDGRVILINEEAARWAYGAMQDSFKERTGGWKPAYRPSLKAKGLLGAAKDAVALATATPERRERARLFDRALAAVSVAWQQVLVEHGRQTAADPDARKALRWGLTLDETAASRPTDAGKIAKAVDEAGAGWVRLVFGFPEDDPAFAKEASFTPYDELVKALRGRGVAVMGSLFDSLLWPADTTPEFCAARAKALVARYKASVRSWEVAGEPNGTWLGGRGRTDDELVLDCVRRAAAEVRSADPALERTATLHWWDGTAPDGRHGLRDWLPWAKERGFGDSVDAVGLSVYPHRHPLGLSLEPAFRDLRAAFPGKPLFLGGWSYGDGGERPAYWWLSPEAEAVEGARKDLMLLYNAAAPALAPGSLGGGFPWQTLELMLPPERQPTALYRLYKKSLYELKR